MLQTNREYYNYVVELPQSRIDLIDLRVLNKLLKEGYKEADTIETRNNVYDGKISDIEKLIDISDIIGKDKNGYYIDITIETENDYYYRYSV